MGKEVYKAMPAAAATISLTLCNGLKPFPSGSEESGTKFAYGTCPGRDVS
ncbi:hypothetical protein ZHAS_00016454 [Anopheles sinensis]|uniref:Uncharacterized protein n=1 Tax=Anopheles sinensis TaxID=74873 RepID=A0A084WE25_ANOSI|nr:hypothetical protein ZHAS_00016454 [Anopheles sinensis]